MSVFTNITVGQYIPGESPVHRLDPRTKILLSLLLIVILFLIERPVGYGLMAVFLLGCVALSSIPVKFLLRGLRPLVLILVLTFVLHVFMNPGRVVFALGPIKATAEGILRGFLMVTRLVLLVTSTSLLTLTTSPIALTDGLERIMSPFKRIGVPAHELAMMMTIALRFIPTLMEETDKIMKAQMARGADFESGSVVRRAKALIPLLVPLFISAFRRADELATAMEARCYRGGEGRTRMKQLVFSPRDMVAGVVTVSVAVLVALFF